MAILFTGLTGGLGINLIKKLQKKDRVFCLVRNGKKRLRKGVLHGVSEKCIINADIKEDLCGVTKEDINFLKTVNFKKVIHCAALVKFNQELATEIWGTNYIGTKNVLNLAKVLGVNEFHYVSTAYSNTRRNHYEKSKAAAEREVVKSGLNFSIYAPSIIVGDSKTGKIDAFDGFYSCFASVFKIIQKELAKGKKKNEINFPINIYCSSSVTSNLVTLDWVVDMLDVFVDLFPVGKKYYLTHPNPPIAREVLKIGYEHIGLNGFKFYEDGDVLIDCQDRYMKKIQSAVDKIQFVYKKYVAEERLFPLHSTMFALGEKYFFPPDISRELICRLLNYAMSCKFKKNSF